MAATWADNKGKFTTDNPDALSNKALAEVRHVFVEVLDRLALVEEAQSAAGGYTAGLQQLWSRREYDEYSRRFDDALIAIEVQIALNAKAADEAKMDKEQLVLLARHVIFDIQDVARRLLDQLPKRGGERP